MHPVFGVDHLLAMIGVGVVSAQLGGRNIWRIPAADQYLGAAHLWSAHRRAGHHASMAVEGIAFHRSDGRFRRSLFLQAL
jgi:HupE/UreJ protein